MAVMAPLPLRVSVPPLTTTVLVDESVLVKMRLPPAVSVPFTVGSGVLDSVSGTLPEMVPANVTVVVGSRSGAFDCVTVPVNVTHCRQRRRVYCCY